MAEQPSEQRLWVKGESEVVRYCWEFSSDLSTAECDGENSFSGKTGHSELLSNRPD
jgi:hypothetical protein